MLSIWLIMTSIASSLAGLLGRGRWIFIRSKEREENRSQDMVDEYQYQQRAELELAVPRPGRNLEKRAKYGQWLSWFLIGSCWFTGSITWAPRCVEHTYHHLANRNCGKNSHVRFCRMRCIRGDRL
jgi:hypothetical protein